MTPGAVARNVDEHAITGFRGAHTESLELPRTNHVGEAGGATGAPALGEAGVHRMEVDVPRAVIVADQHGSAAVLGEEMVRLQGGRGDVTIPTQLEHHPQLIGEMDERVECVGGQRLAGQRADLSCSRPPTAVVVGHLVTTHPVDPGREVVDERRGDEYDIISV